MNKKIIGALLALFLGFGTIASNGLAFAALGQALNFQPSTLLPFTPDDGVSGQVDTGPSVVESRNLGDGVVPDLVGINLNDASQLISLSGYDFVFYEEISAGSLVSLDDSDSSSKSLFVCKQGFPAGAVIAPEAAPTMIETVVSKDCSGASNAFLVGKAKANQSSWEPIRPTEETSNVVQGWIYGFAGEDEEVRKVQVITYSGVQTYELAMIDLVGTGGCDLNDSEWQQYISDAITSKHAKLPIGAPVATVLNWIETNDNEAFLHLLNVETGQYAEEPPAGSANQALVAEGLWVPAGEHIRLGPDYVAQKKQRWMGTDGFVDLNDLGKRYRKLLVTSANTTRKTPKPVLAACISFWTRSFIAAEGGIDVRWKYGIPGGYVPPGCTWVNPYIRRGHWVSGYFRCG